MSTVQIARPGSFEACGQRSAAARAPRAGPVLLVALMALLLYAAFDHGAGGVSAGARLQVATSALAAAAVAAWLWTGTMRVAAPRTAVAAVGSLTAFAVWSGVTILWSVAPDQTWVELNRALTYVLVLGIAIVAGASSARSFQIASWGGVAIVAAVAVYALAEKLAPGLHLPGLDQTQLVPRLQQPFGYWNALGLFLVFGVSPGLALAADRALAPRVRLGALLCVELMLLAIGLTYSRGAVVALVFALAVWIGLSGARLRSLLWLAVVCVTTVPPLVFGLVDHNLTTASVSLGSRELAGVELAVVLVATLVGLWLAGRELIRLERRVTISPAGARRIGRWLGRAVGVVAVCGLLAVALSSRGLTGTASHAWQSFTTTHTNSIYDPRRLLSADSENRWVWWKEAAGAFSDRPLTGWGAGSFGVVHLLYRRDTTSVKQPHSVPLQLLAETGILGALLALGSFGLLVVTGVGTARRLTGGERMLAAALLAAVVAYGVHALYDWDWDIPGVTLPALVFAGVLAGARGRGTVEPRRVPAPGPAARLLGLAAACALLCSVALSGVVPSVAATKARAALVAASSSSPAALASAQANAAAAARLDPLSDAGLLAEVTIALHRGQLQQPRTYLLEAIRRDPEDVQAWRDLASFEFSIGDLRAAVSAIERVMQLDPMGAESLRYARVVGVLTTPPVDSAASAPVG
jgi:hypothetical protein